VLSDVTGGVLKMTTTFNTELARRDGKGNKMIGGGACGNAMKVPSYIYLPNKFRAPLEINLTIRINAPELHVMLGGGLLSFGLISGGTNMRDISGESHATGKGRYFNHLIPFGEFFTLRILYGLECMLIEVNGEPRYYSESERYMTSKAFPGLNGEGLEFRITCRRHSELAVKECAITEYDNGGPAWLRPETPVKPYAAFADKTTKPDLGYCVSGLNKDIKDEIMKTNESILKLTPLKLKRKIEGTGSRFCRITYISDYGFSYHVHTEANMAVHYMNWILYNTRREQVKYGGVRKRELTAETLVKLSETSPEFAARMYGNLIECDGCACVGLPKECGLDGCVMCGNKTYGLCSTLIAFGGDKKASCHGKMEFVATPSGFADARRVIETVNGILPPSANVVKI